jgi:hypothetical protein
VQEPLDLDYEHGMCVKCGLDCHALVV